MTTRGSTIWLVVVVLFTLANLAGAVMAAAGGEMIHASVHVALTLLGAYGVRHRWRPWDDDAVAATEIPSDLNNHLTHLELSVEAVALEVERVGEGQRFITNFFVENGIPRAEGEGVAEPIEVKTGE